MIAVDLKLAIFIYDIERLFYKTILITVRLPSTCGPAIHSNDFRSLTQVQPCKDPTRG